MDILALAALVLSTAWSQLAVPDLHLGDLVEPTVQAAILTPLVLTALLAFRLGGVAPVWERRLLALFLLAMPTVYLGALALHGGTRSWFTTELVGQLAFATLAMAGLRGSGWILVFGLAALGVGPLASRTDALHARLVRHRLLDRRRRVGSVRRESGGRVARRRRESASIVDAGAGTRIVARVLRDLRSADRPSPPSWWRRWRRSSPNGAPSCSTRRPIRSRAPFRRPRSSISSPAALATHVVYFRVYNKDHYGQDGDPVLVWQSDTATMSPSVDPAVIASAYEADSAAAASEYGGAFRSDLEAFVSRKALEACIIPNRRELPPAGHTYVAFADPSGGTSDSFTLAVCHGEARGEQTIAVVDCVREMKPPFSPESVVRELATLLKSYRVAKVSATSMRASGPPRRSRSRTSSMSRPRPRRATSTATVCRS